MWRVSQKPPYKERDSHISIMYRYTKAYLFNVCSEPLFINVHSFNRERSRSFQIESVNVKWLRTTFVGQYKIKVTIILTYKVISCLASEWSMSRQICSQFEADTDSMYPMRVWLDLNWVFSKSSWTKIERFLRESLFWDEGRSLAQSSSNASNARKSTKRLSQV